MLDPEGVRRRVRERLAEQRELVETLLRQREQLQGSLFARFGQCGKESCVCRLGRKHGPYYVLSTRSAGKGGFAYLEQGKVAEARELVLRYRDFRSGMRRLKRINAELVDLLRRYQEVIARRGGQRLGLVAFQQVRK